MARTLAKVCKTRFQTTSDQRAWEKSLIPRLPLVRVPNSIPATATTWVRGLGHRRPSPPFPFSDQTQPLKD